MNHLLLPDGYRFHPTDLEVIDYLFQKLTGGPLPTNGFLTEFDLYGDREPGELFSGVKENTFYIFTKLKKRKECSTRIVRTVTVGNCIKGTWKNQTPKDILGTTDKLVIGCKRSFLYERYKKGLCNDDTGCEFKWLMKEFCILDEFKKGHVKPEFQDYVLCKITRKKSKSRNVQEVAADHHHHQPPLAAEAEKLQRINGNRLPLDCLPYGIRFHPIDKEIINFLWYKVTEKPFMAERSIGECDIYGHMDPSELFGGVPENVFYIFCKLRRKTEGSVRVERTVIVDNHIIGTWKNQKPDKIVDEATKTIIGCKRSFVYERKSNNESSSTLRHRWLMTEFTLPKKAARHVQPQWKDYVLCKIKRVEVKPCSQEAVDDKLEMCDQEPVASDELDKVVKRKRLYQELSAEELHRFEMVSREEIAEKSERMNLHQGPLAELERAADELQLAAEEQLKEQAAAEELQRKTLQHLHYHQQGVSDVDETFGDDELMIDCTDFYPPSPAAVAVDNDVVCGKMEIVGANDRFLDPFLQPEPATTSTAESEAPATEEAFPSSGTSTVFCGGRERDEEFELFMDSALVTSPEATSADCMEQSAAAPIERDDEVQQLPPVEATTANYSENRAAASRKEAYSSNIDFWSSPSIYWDY